MRSLLSPAQHSALEALRRRPATVPDLARRLPHLRHKTLERACRALLELGAVSRSVRIVWARYPARGAAHYLYRAVAP